MKHARKVSLGIMIGLVLLALRRLAIRKGLGRFGWYDSREEAFQKAKAKVDATEPSVARPFMDRQF